LAYTKNPMVATYDTSRVSLVGSPLQRTGNPNKDYRLVNMFVELYDSPTQETKKAFIKSRPGLSTTYTVNSGTARGIFYWIVGGIGYTFTVVADKVYVNGVLLQTLTTTTGQVGFTLFVQGSGTVSLIMLDGIKGYIFSSPLSAGTEIVSADFPTPHVPFPIFMDAYLFVAKAGTQDIYNSNVDDPTLWTAGDYISAEMYPDTIKALTKNNNYIYAIGSDSVEYFYDAAIATGSPLQKHDSAVQQFGTVAPYSVVQTEKEVIFIGATGNGGNTVWTIDGFKEKEIGIPMVKNAFLIEGSALPNCTAYCIRISGQKFYFIRLTTRTLVYSFDTKLWHEWSSGATGTLPFVGEFAADGPGGTAFMLNKNGGSVYTISESNYTDAGTSFMCEVVTTKIDLDTINRKFASRLAIIGDIPDGGGTENTFYVSWSDDDYVTWSAERALNYLYDFPVIKQLGAFRRRAFRIRYSLPHLVRLEGIELDYNKGQQ